MDQLMADRALPAAVKQITGSGSGTANRNCLPPFLQATAGGCPVYELDHIFADEPLPRPVAEVSLPDVPEGAFMVQLTHPTLERMPNKMFAPGAWVVFEPPTGDDLTVAIQDQLPRLILSSAGAFNATHARWTLGRPSLRGDKVHVLYNSNIAPPAERPLRRDVRVIGRAYATFVNGVMQRLGGRV